MFIVDNGFDVALMFEDVELFVKKYDDQVRFYADFLNDSSFGYFGERIFLAEFNKIDFMLKIKEKTGFSNISIQNIYNDVVDLLKNDVKNVEDLFKFFLVNNFRDRIEAMHQGNFIRIIFEKYFLEEIFNKYRKK